MEQLDKLTARIEVLESAQRRQDAVIFWLLFLLGWLWSPWQRP
jgi:hypothetical protein